MLTRNEDGDRFMPFNQPAGSPFRATFDKAVLGMTPDQAILLDSTRRSVAPLLSRAWLTASVAVKLVGAFQGHHLRADDGGHARSEDPCAWTKASRDPSYPLR